VIGHTGGVNDVNDVKNENVKNENVKNVPGDDRHLTRTMAADAAGLRAAVEVMARDGVVAVPTETVYGLAGRGLSVRAVQNIYAAKGRPADNPVILHVHDESAAWPLFAFRDAGEATARRRAEALARRFWPGPLTIVGTASAVVPDVVRAGLPKVAVRVPAHPFARQLAEGLGEPFAAPSANLSGRPSPTTAADVAATLTGRIELIIDGGPCARGIESSVVDVSGERPRLLRPGALSVLELKRVLPDLDVRAPGLAAHGTDASPGLRHKHYAPEGGAALVPASWLSSLWGDDDTGIIARQRDVVGLAVRRGFVAVLPDDGDGYARELFSALYRAERARPGRLVVVDVPHDESWIGVRDRLLRATVSEG